MTGSNGEKILLAHGGGGILMKELVRFILERLGVKNDLPLQDSAIIESFPGKIAFTTDSFVIDPVFFPGGDIGHLAVCGTVNDLAVCGAVPLAISLSFIIEEGFAMADLGRIVDSIRMTSEEAGISVITGDTKVVEKGKVDGIFINTAGIGNIPDGIGLSSASARPGDVVIINGTIGDHGLAILSMRENLDFGSALESDTAPLSTLIVPLLKETDGIRVMRDATRGGLAAVLNEIAEDSDVCIEIEEASIPLRDAVRKGCELMGYEPLHIANEGKFVTIVDPGHAGEVLDRMRRHPLGKDAAVIGSVRMSPGGHVIMKTLLGGERVVDIPYGDLLPRIC
ncbi:MAG: hydrogenase expression/formation protein HypE [Candidatus Krumholzibacteriota bacterium]|nr:hydrogenase expression/formation protein HypE [Candidatus Krumholzibacteriota bacterium]